ncbi:MAG: type III-A CRISPR-associated protein Cas10/Csm1, partial [Nitrospirae bacterium]
MQEGLGDRAKKLQLLAFYRAIEEFASRAGAVYEAPLKPEPQDEEILNITEKALGLDTPEEDGFAFLSPLFQKISLSDAQSTEHKALYYPHHRVDSEPLLPEPPSEASLKDNCPNLWEGFFKELSLIKKHTPHNLFVLLQRYTFCLPWRRYRNCDISLFDHARLHSALAGAYVQATEVERPFVLVGGDFSGIQQFIYTITSKGALKTLRARSFFLELFSEHVVHEVLKEFCLCPANIIISGGGRFTLLVPNTDRTAEFIAQLGHRINQFLLRMFGEKLYLVLEHVDLSMDEVRRVSEKWRQLGQRITEKKRQKFKEFFLTSKDALMDFFGPLDPPEDISLSELRAEEFTTEGTCPYCNSDEPVKV